jgi:hypothetical protein
MLYSHATTHGLHAYTFVPVAVPARQKRLHDTVKRWRVGGLPTTPRSPPALRPSAGGSTPKVVRYSVGVHHKRLFELVADLLHSRTKGTKTPSALKLQPGSVCSLGSGAAPIRAMA